MSALSITKKSPRMSGEERRAAIIQAVMPVFAMKGFAATTTKDLARAADVSEALLYRHFPSKESLYEEIQEQICATQSSIHDYVLALEPSSQSLVKLIYLLFKIIFESKNQDVKTNSVHRLMIQSMLDDGAFAKSFNQPRFEQMLPVLEQCVEAARQAKELVTSPLTNYQRLWFPHHLAMMLRLATLPDQQLFDYQAQTAEQLSQAVWFCLRGIGLKDQVIARCFRPAKFNPVMNQVLAAAGMPR